MRESANGGFAFGERDSGPRVREDKLSPEWRFFYIFGYRQILYCPQRQKEPAIPAKAGISAP
ncbi:MAG: hypothetical protein ACR2QC_05630 [Gammaproteobacteria bacterium]